MKACGIVLAALTSGSPSSRVGLVTGSRMSPQCEPDQTPCEVRVRAHTSACISQNPIATPDRVKKLPGKEMKTLDMDTL